MPFINLKSCPFCGSDSIHPVKVNSSSWQMECLRCSATGPLDYGGENLAAAQWNKRTPQSETAK